MTVCAGSFLFCGYINRWIMRKDSGTPQMRVISDAIKEGSEGVYLSVLQRFPIHHHRPLITVVLGFLQTQYTTVAVIACIVAAVLFIIYALRDSTSSVGSFTLAFVTSLSFLIGAFCSALAG